MTYNCRLQADTFKLQKTGASAVMQKNYEYYAAGNLKHVGDVLDSKFNRLNTFDFAGRPAAAKSAAEAEGGTVTTNQDTQLRYRQSYEFNEYGNMTQRNNLHWGVEQWYEQNNNLNYSYYNDRIVNNYWQHDADGRVTVSAWPDDYVQTTYDARGLITTQTTYPNYGNQSVIERFYNGDGREVKRRKQELVGNPNPPYDYNWVVQDPTYYIRSSVLGGEVLSETDGTGRKKKTFVLAAGAKIATQSEYTYNGNTNRAVSFDHSDASGLSNRTSMTNGVVLNGDGFEGAPAETDPMGGNVGMSTPYLEVLQPTHPPTEMFPYLEIAGDSPMYVNGQQVSCTLDGMSIGCGQAMSMLGHSADIDFAHTDSFLLGQLGIFAQPTYTTTYQRIPVDIPGVLSAYTVTQTFTGYEYFFSNISWGPQQQTQQPPLTITNIIDEAKRVIRETPSCRDIFAADVDPIKLLEDFEKGIIGNISFGALASPPGLTVHATTVPALGPPINTVGHLGYPLKISTGISNVNITLNNILSSPGRERYGLNTLQDRVVTLIHELGHAANFIRNNFANANPGASAILDDDITRPAVSKNNSDFVNANCFGALSRLIQPGAVQ